MLKCFHIHIFIFSLIFASCGNEAEYSKDPAAPNRKKHLQNLIEIAREKQEIGAYFEAVEELQKALKIDPNFIPVQYQLGSIFEEWDNRPKAIKVFKKVLQLEPGHVDARMKLASLYSKQVKSELAVREYKKAAELRPEDKTIFFKIALEFWYLQRFPETIEYYKKAIALDPGYLQAHLNLASVYERIKEWEKALKEINISLDLAKKSQDQHATSIAKNKLLLIKGRMNMTDQDLKRKTQPPFD